jgi:O-antigen/teichoic acid export membrane protein
MQRSYTSNYLKIYFWQILSILLNLLSLFIVIPKLTSQPPIYGIYSICISSIIFLSYADLGFINAGYKYASEYYANNLKSKEIGVIGFVTFILLVFVLLFAVVMTTIAFHPEWLIKGIHSEEHIQIARSLLLILAFFSPNIVLQRALQIIFGLRLEDFKLQRVLVGVSLLKILSVFYFFRSGHFEIVAYFFFSQLVMSLGLLSAFYISKKKFDFSFFTFIKSIKFSGKIYDEVKTLAFSSLFVTISWILYYELDIYAIAKLSGAESVAYYSIGLTCMAFFRSIFGALFSPFTARFNHFLALDDMEGLRKFYKTIIVVLLPVVVFPVLSLFFLGKPFVYSWVGEKFSDSVLIVRLLVLSNVLAFITYPCGILIMARKKIKVMYYLAAIQPLIFWGGVIITLPLIGYISFAYFKLAVFLINGGFYLWASVKFLELKTTSFLKDILMPSILPIAIVFLVIYLLHPYLPVEKNKLNLVVVVGVGGLASGLAVIAYYFTAATFRNSVNNVISKLLPKFSTKK